MAEAASDSGSSSSSTSNISKIFNDAYAAYGMMGQPARGNSPKAGRLIDALYSTCEKNIMDTELVIEKKESIPNIPNTFINLKRSFEAMIKTGLAQTSSRGTMTTIGKLIIICICIGNIKAMSAILTGVDSVHDFQSERGTGIVIKNNFPKIDKNIICYRVLYQLFSSYTYVFDKVIPRTELGNMYSIHENVCALLVLEGFGHFENAIRDAVLYMIRRVGGTVEYYQTSISTDTPLCVAVDVKSHYHIDIERSDIKFVPRSVNACDNAFSSGIRSISSQVPAGIKGYISSFDSITHKYCIASFVTKEYPLGSCVIFILDPSDDIKTKWNVAYTVINKKFSNELNNKIANASRIAKAVSIQSGIDGFDQDDPQEIMEVSLESMGVIPEDITSECGFPAVFCPGGVSVSAATSLLKKNVRGEIKERPIELFSDNPKDLLALVTKFCGDMIHSRAAVFYKTITKDKERISCVSSGDLMSIMHALSSPGTHITVPAHVKTEKLNIIGLGCVDAYIPEELGKIDDIYVINSSGILEELMPPMGEMPVLVEERESSEEDTIVPDDVIDTAIRITRSVTESRRAIREESNKEMSEYDAVPALIKRTNAVDSMRSRVSKYHSTGDRTREYVNIAEQRKKDMTQRRREGRARILKNRTRKQKHKGRK